MKSRNAQYKVFYDTKIDFSFLLAPDEENFLPHQIWKA